jgi:hypothetical protein
MTYYIVTYTGHFAFIKPWTAVRDGETFSQQFLTPSIVAGIERKLFPELLHVEPFMIHKIIRHRLSYSDISIQQEITQSRGWNIKKKEKLMQRPRSILNRGVMLNPVLFLAFSTREDACAASDQHICLCRNEDILYPEPDILEISNEIFDCDEERFSGFELIFENTSDSFLVGFNRLNHNAPMYGWLKIVGTPVRTNL